MLAVLRRPGVPVLFGFACVARLPMGAIGLLLVIHTEDLTGSYAAGGVVAGAYVLALGATAPGIARFVDRRGQTLVLVVGAVATALAVVALALVPEDVALGPIVALAAVAGAATPPVGACMRALWPSVLPDDAGRHAAYSMESVALEVVYILGPVAIAGGIGAVSIPAALVACAAFVLVGTLVFASRPVSRAWRPDGDAQRDLVGPLRGGGVRLLVGVFALCGLGVGAVEVVVPAQTAAMGVPGLVGPLLGLWGVGSMFAGILVGRLGPPRDAPRRLAALLVAWGAGHAAIGLAETPVALGAALLLAGVWIAPTFVTGNGMLDGLAPAGTLTEAFTWTSTGLTAGMAAGSAAAGALVEAGSPALATLLLSSAAVLGAIAVRASPARLRAAVPA